MLRRFIKDESGIAMGLAVIVVVIVGVMGAGLLVFVRNDLEAVVEVNSGQQAFDAADAGAQAAKRHLLSESDEASFDGGGDDSDWSYDTGGKDLTFDNQNVNVEIRYLEPAADETETETEGFTPEIIDADDNRRFFRVESTGNSESGAARRKVEAIYNTYDLGVPKAYYSPNDITITGTADIKNVSIFSRGDVDIKGSATITGEDQVYGNWAEDPDMGAPNEYNDEPRPTTDAGVGALGSITGGGSDRNNRDFDGSTTPPFKEDPGDGEMTFPFNVDEQSGDADQDRIDFLRDEAIRQESETGDDHYYDLTGSGNESLDSWPDNSGEDTVVFVEFENPATLKWNVPESTGAECGADPGDDDYNPKKGTLVVENGNFTTSQNNALLQGVVLVRGGEADGDSDDTGGNTCIDGFVNASGEIKIAGSVEPFTSDDVLDRPGFYGVEQWSWRELYE